jgi:hypothetical protein
MQEHSETAWNIASRYSGALASETRDLAAQIDATLAAERERCASELMKTPGRIGYKQAAAQLRNLGQGTP